MNRTLVFAAAAACILGAGSAAAQDWTAPATFATISLSAGFQPDPHEIVMQAGGSIDASGVGCYGMVANEPDVELSWSGNGGPLVISAESDTDTTLVINGPDGEWYCDDDSGGFPNPMVTFDSAMSGTYDIWVGTFSTDGGYPATTLRISEFTSGGGGSPGSGGFPSGGGGGMPDPSQSGAFGSTSLSAGFQPDPFTVSIPPGGGVDASVLGGECWGFIATAPDFEVYYSAGGFALTFYVDAPDDTTLVINGPDGQWYCDDDSAGYPNPQIDFASPMSGTYDVWIGTFSSDGGGSGDATLYVTELGGPGAGGFPGSPGSGGSFPSGGGDGVEPNASLSGIFGSTSLNAGFVPDPFSAVVTPGGDIDASNALGGNCFGFVTAAPSYEVYYTAGSFPELNIWAESSSADIVMVINAPDGSWYCDDDSAGSLNPELDFVSPLSGTYDIWVGILGSPGASGSATIYVSEGGGPGAGGGFPGSGGGSGGSGGGGGGGAMPDPSQSGTAGSTNLAAGFVPDPFTTVIQPGGSVEAYGALGGNCFGNIAVAPDFEVFFTAGGGPLRFWVDAPGDTTLVINGPDGQWYCDDDSAGNLNPQVIFNSAMSGTYDIWVGNFGDGGPTTSTLHVTEYLN